MYLKSLEVHGFKSFANKLIFEFHDGITAIVGPNGSGKSNVADAVRWVLGEQSAKQLRGMKMEDVIFSGTEMRKPLGYAYVAITISNEDHKLDVPYEEVKIARRVYRSGESEYLLNGASCRLKDVQELLFDTGIGKEGYSIIGQGQIDKILSGKPEERRELFDEAAGIVKYKRRKAAAEKNLEEEKQNLVRIEDILSELTKQVEPLERQAGKAKEYLKYREELKSHDINLFVFEYDRINEEIKAVEQKKEIADTDLANATKEFEQGKLAYDELERVLEECNHKLENDVDEISRDRMLLNTYENDIKVFNEQINTIKQNETHYREQISIHNAKIKELEKELASCQKKIEANELEIANANAVQSENSELAKANARKRKELENQIEALKRQMLNSMNEISDIKTEEQRFRTLIEQNNIRKAELTKRVLENKSEASILTETMELQKSIFEEASEKLNELDRKSQEYAEAVKNIDKKSEKAEQEHREIQQKFHIENSKLNSIKNMTERYEGFGQSIKRVMEKKSENAGIIGVVADIIKVKKEYELAIETALGGSIQNIVTDNEHTAKDMIEYLKKNRFGRATFLPLTNVKAKRVNQSSDILSQKGVIGMASTLVETDDRFLGLIEYLLGKIIVVDNIDNAIVLANKYHHTVRLVTTEGDLINPGGAMSGGAFKNNNNLLGRRREIETLEASVQMLKKKLQDVSEEMSALAREKNSISRDIAENNKLRQEFTIKQNTSKLNYDRAVSDIESNNQKLEFIHFEAKEIESKNAELKLSMDKIAEKLSESEDNNKALSDEVEKLNTELYNEKQNETDISENNSSLIVKVTALKQNGKFLLENIKRITKEKQDEERELENATQSSEGVDRLIEEKKAEIVNVKQKISEIQETIKELEKSIADQREKRDKTSAEHKMLLEKREGFSKEISELEKECFRLENQREKLAGQIDSFIDYMWEQYEITYNGARESRVDNGLDYNEIKKRISELKAQIKSLGDVNVNAIEQYKEVLERYNLLKTQHEDLTEAADVLVGIIKELDSEMRIQFEEQFEEIKNRFNGVFKELFGGGRGTIELVQGEDILQAGITIIAQPPGKKLQNMMQLSGGEKALTAIALLFAIQSLKPSPFCLLDEIEAALDDSNVYRYADYLHRLTKDTQFIVITHRRGTMNAADILYGITMQEKGVSTLVSVNLLDEKELD